VRVGFAEKYFAIPPIGCVFFHFVQNKFSEFEELLILSRELGIGSRRMCFGTSWTECLARFLCAHGVH